MFFKTPNIAAVLAVAAAALIALTPINAEEAHHAPQVGPKKTVSVVGFEAPELVQGGATPEELMALLVNALIQDGRFVVVERAAMTDIQTEQQLRTGGAVTAGTSAQAGKVLASSAIVRGTVTKFEPATSGSSLNVGGFRFLSGGGVGLSAQTARVTISLRVIDTTTSQILYFGTAEGHATARSVEVKGGTGLYEWNGGAFLKTPLGDALQDAIRKSVDQIAAAVAKLPWSALVIDNDGTNVFITAGADQGIWQGAVFHVYRKGKELTDPGTGAVLDVLLDPVGVIEVQSVRDKVSIAKLVSGDAPARGDIVREK